jgi:ABC-type lipoprotein export system ATPase subunit
VELTTLQREAAQRAQLRRSGADRADGHIVCEGLVRIFKPEGVEVVALQGLDLVVHRGELVAIVGASGSGKSTLLNILSGLDVPTAGSATVAGYDLLRMSGRRRLEYRRRMVGFVWQQTSRNLFSYLTAAENVALPITLARTKRSRREVAARVSELLELVGLADAARLRPAQMSGGERQRCAVAVAAANQPQVLLADEPTGELDPETADEVFGALRTINAELGATVVVVTHDHAVTAQVRRTVAIRDGRTTSEVHWATRIGADGATESVREEYVVLDRAGRMQLPAEFVAALSLHDRVRLNLEPDHVQVHPATAEADGDEW